MGSAVAPSDIYAYFPLVNPALFPALWVLLLAAGILFMGWFFVYEVSVSSSRRSLSREVALASVSSLLLGSGSLFLLLWSGVWVWIVHLLLPTTNAVTNNNSLIIIIIIIIVMIHTAINHSILKTNKEMIVFSFLSSIHSSLFHCRYYSAI